METGLIAKTDSPVRSKFDAEPIRHAYDDLDIPEYDYAKFMDEYLSAEEKWEIKSLRLCISAFQRMPITYILKEN